MRSRARSVVIVLAGLIACTPLRPQVSLEPGVSLKSYHVVAIGPVEDRSGYPFHYPIGDSLHVRLVDALEQDEVPIVSTNTDTTVPVLFVVSSLDRFKNGALNVALPSSLGTSECVFSSRLLDGHTGRRLGEIVSSEIIDPEDTPRITPQQLLTTCTQITADELKRRLK
ncbi:MAG TPA: hypothetical protein VLT79_02560 [Gemmatimonadales bacterium]|nr:hypothetical protein [Gemmatimonadales bacterium]